MNKSKGKTADMVRHKDNINNRQDINNRQAVGGNQPFPMPQPTSLFTSHPGYPRLYHSLLNPPLMLLKAVAGVKAVEVIEHIISKAFYCTVWCYAFRYASCNADRPRPTPVSPGQAKLGWLGACRRPLPPLALTGNPGYRDSLCCTPAAAIRSECYG